MSAALRISEPQMKMPHMVKTKVLFPAQEFMLELRPAVDNVDLSAWCELNREFLEQSLLKYGGVAFRGFNVKTSEFRKVTDSIYPEPPNTYVGGQVLRPEFADGVYLTNVMDKGCTLPQHHELSFYRSWPMKIFFFCDTPATSGGETPIVSTRQFMKKLDPAIYDSFKKREVLYLRNYNHVSKNTWQQLFKTDDRAKVEEFCKSNGLDVEWHGNGYLRTRHKAQGVAIHPKTGEELWHNHSHMYNYWNKGQMTPMVQMTKPIFTSEALERLLNADHMDVPMQSYYADGSMIESEVFEEISWLLEQEKVSIPWEKGDFMMLDNMLTFHGRNPYEGDQRKILVVMKQTHG